MYVYTYIYVCVCVCVCVCVYALNPCEVSFIYGKLVIKISGSAFTH